MKEGEGISQRIYIQIHRHRQHSGYGQRKRVQRLSAKDKGGENGNICNSDNNKNEVKNK